MDNWLVDRLVIKGFDVQFCAEVCIIFLSLSFFLGGWGVGWGGVGEWWWVDWVVNWSVG